jgi:threonine aldolase
MSTGGRGFGSDNHAGAHPEVMAAIVAANTGHVHGYGDDPYTRAALGHLRSHFGEQIEAFPVLNGTGANVVCVAAACRPYQAVICAASAHMNTDECGAPERFTGCKLITVAAPDGRLTPELLDQCIPGRGDEHQVQPALVSITQSTEVGTVYTPEMVRDLADAAHRRGMQLHMDGARLANAAASLDCGLAAVSGAAGVDLLSFGGTKNGMLMGEAVIVFDPALARELPFLRKQGMQLASKMRFLSVQFSAMLSGDLWRRNAAHANAMAQRLACGLAQLPDLELTQPTEANGVFVRLPLPLIPRLREQYIFYLWNEARGEARLMTSYDTTTADVDGFLELLSSELRSWRQR